MVISDVLDLQRGAFWVFYVTRESLIFKGEPFGFCFLCLISCVKGEPFPVMSFELRWFY